MVDPDFDFQRHRVQSEATADRMLVRAALAELLAPIEGWQREAAFLRVMWDRPGGTQNDIRPRIARLAKNLDDATQKLDQIVDRLPERLRSHSQVLDVRRAIRGISSSLPT